MVPQQGPSGLPKQGKPPRFSGRLSHSLKGSPPMPQSILDLFDQTPDFASDLAANLTPAEAGAAPSPKLRTCVYKPGSASGINTLELIIRNICGQNGHAGWLSDRLIIGAMKATKSERVAHALWTSSRCGEKVLAVKTSDDTRGFVPVACDRKWCPTCMKDWSRRLTKGLLGTIPATRANRIYHLVLTVPNCKHGELKDRLDFLYNCFREWRNQGRRERSGGWWKSVRGYAWKLEIDHHEQARKRVDERTGRVYTTRAGYHPHVHCIIYSDRGIDLRAGSPALDAWRRLVGKIHDRPCAPHITRANDAFSAAVEVAKYAAKPLQIKHMRGTSLAELAEATMDRRFHGAMGELAFKIREKAHESCRLICAVNVMAELDAKLKGDPSQEHTEFEFDPDAECWAMYREYMASVDIHPADKARFARSLQRSKVAFKVTSKDVDRFSSEDDSLSD